METRNFCKTVKQQELTIFCSQRCRKVQTILHKAAPRWTNFDKFQSFERGVLTVSTKPCKCDSVACATNQFALLQTHYQAHS